MNFYSYKDRNSINLDLVFDIQYKDDKKEVWFLFGERFFDSYNDLTKEEFNEIKKELSMITNTFLKTESDNSPKPPFYYKPPPGSSFSGDEHTSSGLSPEEKLNILPFNDTAPDKPLFNNCKKET